MNELHSSRAMDRSEIENTDLDNIDNIDNFSRTNTDADSDYRTASAGLSGTEVRSDSLLSGSNREARVGEDRIGEDRIGEDRIGEDRGSDQETGYGQLDMADGAARSNGLFATNELDRFRSSWSRVQASFVDEPRAAVEQADTLVSEVVNRITEQFSAERDRLETQWSRGEKADTEALRQAFRRYRTFFERLLSFKGVSEPASGVPRGI